MYAMHNDWQRAACVYLLGGKQLGLVMVKKKAETFRFPHESRSNQLGLWQYLENQYVHTVACQRRRQHKEKRRYQHHCFLV